MDSAKSNYFVEVSIPSAKQAVEYAEASSEKPYVIDVGGLKRDLEEVFTRRGWSESAASNAAHDCLRAVLIGN